jgi:hypothetical protein
MDLRAAPRRAGQQHAYQPWGVEPAVGRVERDPLDTLGELEALILDPPPAGAYSRFCAINAARTR